MKRLLPAALLAVLALTGCGPGAVATHPASRPFPQHVLPGVVHGLTVRSEPSAQNAFARIGPTSTVSRGALWSLRRGAEVVASFQLSQLKDPLSTKDDDVRRGVRAAVGNWHYRWFKVDERQWVGVQEKGELSIYLWFPARTDLFVVAQASQKVADSEALVGALIEAEGLSS